MIQGQKNNLTRAICGLGNKLLLIVLIVPHFGFAQKKFDTSNAEDAKIVSEPSGPVVSGASKNEKEKIIDFTLQNPLSPEEKIHAQFHFDPSENKEIAVIRKAMNWQHEELLRQIEFTRVFLNLPADMDPRAVFERYYYIPQTVRDEIHRQYDLKGQSAVKIAKNAFMRPASGNLHGFGAQSILFAGAIGGLMYLQLLTDYASDPLSMVKHLDSLTDPIAHMAFFSFMAANGFASDMLLKKYAGVPGRVGKTAFTPKGMVSASTMRIAIPYLGMSAGMMASSLTAEVLGLMKTCVSELLKKKDGVSMMAKAMGQMDPCDQAKNEFFNFDNKVEQYIPMMLSMAVSAGTLTFAQKGYVGGKAIIAGSNAGKKIAGSKLFETASKLSKPTLQFIGLRMAASVTPAGWVFNSITVGAALVSLSQAAGFIFVDHSVNPIVSKLWAQFWRAGSVDNYDEALLKFFQHNQKNNWNLDSNYTDAVKKHQARSDKHTYNIVPVLKTFQEQMDAWRLINHTKYFNGMQIWTQMTSDLLRELQATENFYGAYIGEVFNAFKSQHIVKTEGKIEDGRKWKATYLPFRTFPLFGVKPTGHASCESDPENCTSDAEYNWFNPDMMVDFQKETIKQMIPKFENAFIAEQQKRIKLRQAHLSVDSESKIKEIVEKLKNSSDQNEIGKILLEINKIIKENTLNDPVAVLMLGVLRKNLGDPHPVVVPGMALPNMYMELFPQYFEKMPVKRRNGFTFKTYPEYLFYHMICGPDFKDTNDVLSQKLGFAPKFNPPRIISKNTDIRIEVPAALMRRRLQSDSIGNTSQIPPFIILCSQLVPQGVSFEIPFDSLYYSKVFEGGKSQGENLMKFMSRSIKAPILGNWTDTKEESTTNADKWWLDNVKPLFSALFVRLDTEFQSLLNEMVEGLNSEKLSNGLFNTVIDPAGIFKRTQAGRGLFKSSNQELNTYLTLLAEIEMVQNLENYKKNQTKLNKDFTFIELMNSGLYARVDSQKNLVKTFAPIYNALKNLKPTKGKISLPFADKELSQHQANVQAAVKAYEEHLKTLKLSPYHEEIVGLSFQGMNKMVSQMTAYLLNTQLTNFSAAEAYKDILAISEQGGSYNENTKIKRTRANPHGL